jgi:hypothetical protein
MGQRLMGEANRRRAGEEAMRANITAAKASAAKLADMVAAKGWDTKISVMDLDTGRWKARSETEMRHTFRVGACTVEMTFDTTTCNQTVRFLPNMPDPKSLSRQEMAQYRAGRDDFYAKIGERLGGRVAVVEC